mmetsp:Transcript_69551/g.148764  ORF Transcript_69551/g.148764 Transcript_69551/m.148764 type:complete len:562 (-) Transcript_69551:53-1738(-)
MSVDVETGNRSFTTGEVEIPSHVFPCEPLKCCPSLVTALLPRTWQRVQDWTHLILLLGIFSNAGLVGQTLISFGWSLRCSDFPYIKEILILLFILPCTFYCVKIIGQYDDRLQSKQQQAKTQKENLKKTYNDFLLDMDGLLTKAAESSAGLAERSFESKRRDFQRFLERAKHRYSSLYSGTKADSDQLLRQFRRFCINWLNVFEECSIDPIVCPKRVVTVEELNRCTDVVEVANLCLERLRTTEVRFISMQRDQDVQMVRKNRNELRRLTVTQESVQRLALTAGAGAGDQPALSTGTAPGQRRRVSWLTLGSGGFGFRSTSGSAADGFPKELRFGCGRLVVLSNQHALIMCGVIVGCAIIMLETLSTAGVFAKVDDLRGGCRNSHYFTLLAGCISQVCLLVVLYRFEDLDTIQQLEREVKELSRQNQHVEQQREKMRGFWSNAQQLTELWLYRTVPRLDLYKEIHSQLEDAPAEDLLTHMSGANQQLEDLDQKLGALQAWRNDGTIKVDAKKQFGKAINQLCQEQEFDEILVKMEDVTKNTSLAVADGASVVITVNGNGEK